MGTKLARLLCSEESIFKKGIDFYRNGWKWSTQSNKCRYGEEYYAWIVVKKKPQIVQGKNSKGRFWPFKKKLRNPSWKFEKDGLDSNRGYSSWKPIKGCLDKKGYHKKTVQPRSLDLTTKKDRVKSKHLQQVKTTKYDNPSK